jgi:ribonuclease HI
VITIIQKPDCQALTQQLKVKHKQIALQWILGHCQIAGNEHADALAKKGAKIIQTHTRENILPFY